jgi:hypothetical protein
MAKIGVVFLDVGGTLGRVDAQLQLHPFATTSNVGRRPGPAPRSNQQRPVRYARTRA